MKHKVALALSLLHLLWRILEDDPHDGTNRVSEYFTTNRNLLVLEDGFNGMNSFVSQCCYLVGQLWELVQDNEWVVPRCNQSYTVTTIEYIITRNDTVVVGASRPSPLLLISPGTDNLVLVVEYGDDYYVLHKTLEGTRRVELLYSLLQSGAWPLC